MESCNWKKTEEIASRFIDQWWQQVYSWKIVLLFVYRIENHHRYDDLRFTLAHVQLTKISRRSQIFISLKLRQPKLNFVFGFKAQPIGSFPDYVSWTFGLPHQGDRINWIRFKHDLDSFETCDSCFQLNPDHHRLNELFLNLFLQMG